LKIKAIYLVPPPPFGSYYVQPSNYTLIEASDWNVKDAAFSIDFDMSTLTQLYSIGVYTIILVAQDGSDQVLLTTTSIF